MPSPRRFVHLHNHTEHSKQDGLSRLSDLVVAAKKDRQPALAMTDHGNISGAWKFAQACKAAGIKPILGYEAYIALVPDGSGPDEKPLAWDDPRVRFAKTTRMQPDAESGKVKRNTNNHLTVLVRNETGWRNLCRIVNAAEESFYYKPLIDYALLKQHGEGLIVLTGCLGGPVASQVAMARTDIRDDDGTVTGVEWDEAALGRARTALDHLIECVGRENVYVEIMDHGLSAEGVQHIKKLAELAHQADVGVAATNDSHFVDSCDDDAHDSWLVNGEIARGNRVRKCDPDRWRFNGAGYHLRTAEEMYDRFPKAPTWQDACARTVEIADRVDADVIPYKPLRLPRFPVPHDVVADWQAGAETTVDGPDGEQHPARRVGRRSYKSPAALHLHRLVRTGAVRRYGDRLPENVKQRLAFEFDVITEMGLEDYFLIVWDALGWARSDRGMPNERHPRGAPGGKQPILIGPGRGSAAGSAVSYSLGIVQVDPMANGLLFERFLDPSRAGMPDIDVDFEAARRDEVYDYLAARYGADYVARIGAFQVAKTKRAIKDAARVLDLRTDLAAKLTEAVPVHQGKPQSFAELFEEVLDREGNPIPNPEAGEFRDLVDSDSALAEVVALARKFEDVIAGESIHAAGVIVSDESLTSLMPMYRKRDKKTGALTGIPISCWDGTDIDTFGMLKLDALSLSNLDVVAAAVANIRHTTSEVVNPDLLPDPGSEDEPRVSNTFAMLREGRTEGVFQLESPGMTKLCEQIAPTSFADLTALVALYRPGPMAAGTPERYADRKNGRSEVDYAIYTRSPQEREVIAASLGETFGLPSYQEQLMSLAADVAGFTAAEKNALRKAFSKKNRPAMEALKKTFLAQGQRELPLSDGRTKPAFKASTLEALWVTFDGSAEYLFNKSHAAAYGYIAYVTAFLKANWPTEYAAGLLAVVEKEERRRATLFALRNDGIDVLAPDVNLSQSGTVPDPKDSKAVRLGLSEVRGVGSNARWIVEERERNGDFGSAADLLTRVKVPRKDGSLSKLPVNAVEGLAEAGAFDSLGHPRLGLIIALSALSAGAATDIPDAEWSPLERSARQRARLGVAVGEHPLVAYQERLKSRPDWDLATPLKHVGGHGDVTVFGVVADWAPRTTRRGAKMANVTIEDSDALLSGVVFPKTYAAMSEPAKPGDLVALTGRMVTRTVTSTTLDDEGEEIEESRQVHELTADELEILDVDTELEYRLPEVADDDRMQLAEVINIARARKGQHQPAGDQSGLIDIEELTPPAAAPAPEPAAHAHSRSWNHAVCLTNGSLFYPTWTMSPQQRWLIGSPQDADFLLAPNRTGRDIAMPPRMQFQRDRAFMLRADDLPESTFEEHAERYAGWHGLFITTDDTHPEDDARGRILSIDPAHEKWERIEGTNWYSARLVDVLPLAEALPIEPGDLVPLRSADERGAA